MRLFQFHILIEQFTLPIQKFTRHTHHSFLQQPAPERFALKNQKTQQSLLLRNSLRSSNSLWISRPIFKACTTRTRLELSTTGMIFKPKIKIGHMRVLPSGKGAMMKEEHSRDEGKGGNARKNDGQKGHDDGRDEAGLKEHDPSATYKEKKIPFQLQRQTLFAV